MSNLLAQAWAHFQELEPFMDWYRSTAATWPEAVAEAQRDDVRMQFKAADEQAKSGGSVGWRERAVELERLKSEAHAVGWTQEQWKAVRIVLADDTTLIAKALDGARRQAQLDQMEDAALLTRKSVQPTISATEAEKLAMAKQKHAQAEDRAAMAMDRLHDTDQELRKAMASHQRQQKTDFLRSVGLK